MGGGVRYNRVAQNIIRLFVQRDGIVISKYLDDQMRDVGTFSLKEGWNDLDMSNEFKYGFNLATPSSLTDFTEVDLSRYQGTKLNNSMFSNTGIKKVILPNTIEEIGEGCFNSCINLHSVHFGKNVKKIGKKAFYSCQELEEFNLPEGIEEIGIQAFAQVLHNNLILPSTIKKLGDNCYVPKMVGSTVRFQSLEPPIMSYRVFVNVGRIEVPMAAVETYKNIDVTHWNEKYGDKIVGY